MSNDGKNVKKTKAEPATKIEPDRIVAALAEAERTMGTFEAKFGSLVREARANRESMEAVSEDRRRMADQWDYEEQQRRRAIRDAQIVEDAAREQRHNERLALLDSRERAMRSTIKELLNLDVTAIDREGERAIRDAFDRRLAESEAKGKAIAETQAKTEYETKKKIADAETASQVALLRADNERLRADAAAANARAEKAQTQYDALAARMGDLSRDAFQAAGGLTGKANEALSTAAQSGAARRP